jgi:signal transduction histidine kinase/CheY-like chemotaxis protein
MKFVLGEKMDAFEKIFGSILTGEVPELIEIEWKTKDKRIIFSEVHASISYKDNKISGIQVISRDTTERKKAETLKNVVFNIASAVNIANELNELFGFIKNELAKVIKTENFYIALLDEETDELKLSYYHDSNNHMESFPNVKTLAHYLLNKNNPLLLDENKITDLIKTDVVGEYALGIKSWLGTPLKIKQDTIGVMVVRDYDQKNAFVKEDKQIFEYVSNQIAISIQRKRDYEQLKIAKLAAEESDRLKSAFLANMSHEIRTPMNGILGFAELLKEPELTGEKQEKYIEVIEKSGQRMLNIINDIVDISKIESGLVELQISETNINECIELAFNFFKPEASKKGIKLIHHLNLQTQDAILSTDQEKLNSILINLIKNALKYTDSGKIEFGYTLKKVNSSEYVEFYISDTGIGIQNDRKEAIFDRFIQAEIVDKKARQGAGLGLSISKAYVELLGGKIWVESELGKGSTFYFTLPYSTKKITKVPESNIISDDAHPNRKRLKIMIADDDEVSGQFVSIILAHYYSELLIAQNGAEAVEMCRKNPDIDVVLMDIQMPVMNGYEATKQIREFNKKIIIIAQTAYALYGDKEKSIDVGCNDYISKPIKKEELVSLILKHSNPLVMNL